MFSQCEGTRAAPHPASDACDGWIVKDWATHPRTHGAYSHPTLHAHGARAALGGAVHGSVLLAGEACHEGVNPCIHGAMETGERAAGLAREALSRRREAARWTDNGNAGAPARRSRL